MSKQENGPSPEFEATRNRFINIVNRHSVIVDPTDMTYGLSDIVQKGRVGLDRLPGQLVPMGEIVFEVAGKGAEDDYCPSSYYLELFDSDTQTVRRGISLYDDNFQEVFEYKDPVPIDPAEVHAFLDSIELLEQAGAFLERSI